MDFKIDTFEAFLTEARAPKKKITIKLSKTTEWKDRLVAEFTLNGQPWKFKLVTAGRDSYRNTAGNIHPVDNITMSNNDDWSRAKRVFGLGTSTSGVEDIFFKNDIVISKEAKSFDYIVCSYREAVKVLADYKKEKNTTQSLHATLMRDEPGSAAASARALKVLVEFTKEYFSTTEGVEHFNSVQEVETDKVLVP